MSDTVDPRRNLIFTVVLLGQFVIISSTASLNVALAGVRTGLGATASEIQWVAVIHQLGFAATLITGGRLGDMLGQRRAFLIGMSGLFLGSLAAALAPSPEALIAARLLTGVSGGIASPPTLAFIQTIFPPAERPRAYGTLGMVGAASYLAGQLISGGLVQLDLFGMGWRLAFAVNILVGALGLWAAFATLPPTRPDRRQRLDLAGTALSAATAGLLLYPLITGSAGGWTPLTAAMFCAGPVAGWLFLRHERRLTAREGDPLLDQRLFAVPSFATGLGATIALNMMSFAPFYLVTLALQFGYHFEPFQTAVATTASPIGAVWGARLSGRRAHRPVGSDFWLGAAMMAGGAGATIAIIGTMGDALNAAWLIVPMFFIGASTGLIGASATRLALSHVPQEMAGSASSVLQAAQQFMMSVVMAAGGAMFFALVSGEGPKGHFAAMALTMIAFLTGAALTAIVVRGRAIRSSASSVRQT